ncbi:glycoside hydrolase family 15 protein [Brachybacterium muris]|uniref:Glycoside hydrolase family 15 n=1 Tax=Brachybacterium muris UCD-AY4 TaxID=1249481 RepID=A0A022KZT2_9MICO|nr:glycoside hydrolase family 15 protein [Brachybacterium muris]EYT48846.1 glycoside hydrolase family 15 [Brachybacterium muris UCD-AY4]
MASPLIEDHALLSDQRTTALVTRDGVIDWLCMPRFDSAAMLCSLLGDQSHGHWTLRIAGGEVVSRRYLPETMVLETEWRSPTGSAVITEFMPIAASDETSPCLQGDTRDHSDLIRSVRCTGGTVEVEQELRIRFEYGSVVPWMRKDTDVEGRPVLAAVAGGDALAVHGPALTPQGRCHVGRHSASANETLTWVLTWHPSWMQIPPAPDLGDALEHTVSEWSQWLGQVRVHERYAQPVARSLLVLRALTHRRSGGIVAAATTSLPEDFGGERNWDYRYCWLRDAALSLEALLTHDHVNAAEQWRDWLLRAIAGDPDQLQIMYSIVGDRNLPESELEHLPGYEGSLPVRIGNGAAAQYQADVVGEVMIALGMMRERGVQESEWSWPLQKALVRYTEKRIDQPDQGIWEMRGDPAFFTHGRVMVWATFDRAITAVAHHGMPAAAEDVERWKQLREKLRAEILERGVDESGSFVQFYGSNEVDASLLQIPHTGFVPADDPHMLATVARIEQDLLTDDGLLLRYRTNGQDGLEGDEHPFLVCCFWLVEQYATSGRTEDALTMMDRTLACANDLDLMAEEYDGTAGRMAGNFPQAFSHLGLIRAVDAITGDIRD